MSKMTNPRTLASTLMLVIDYEIPPNENDATVFNAWVRVAKCWTEEQRDAVAKWSSDRVMTASDHVIEKPAPMPACLGRLPFVKNYAPVVLSSRPRLNRRLLEQQLIDAVKRLPCFPKTALWVAFDKLTGQGPAFDDVRIQLINMAFDCADVEKNENYNPNELVKYAMRMLDERLAPSAPIVAPESLTEAQKLIADECGRICAMLIAKNKAYGNSALEPVRIFSKASADEQINVRIDDKLSRLMRGHAAGEDVEDDLVGYIILKKVQKRLSDRSERQG